jgi:hypothetical protein
MTAPGKKIIAFLEISSGPELRIGTQANQQPF